MLPLYPEIKPYARHMLDVGQGHEVYVDESGTPEGIPVLFVHAGPGSGCEFDSRCFFNPQKYRIVLFDQRGAGRSRPHASTEHNTTAELVAPAQAHGPDALLHRQGSAWCQTRRQRASIARYPETF